MESSNRYEQEQKRWMRSQLEILYKISPKYRLLAIDGWQRVYNEEYAKEERVHVRENAAHKAANSRLREYVANVSKSQYQKRGSQ